MNNKGFDILVLNKSYQIVTLLNYTLLQWNRRYFESGNFSIEIPIELYSTEFEYIYTKDRPELGKITQVNFYIKDGYKSVYLSGYFLEEELNKRVAYQKGSKTNITNSPTWQTKKEKAETLAFSFFNDFKDVSYTQNGTAYNSVLGIEAGECLNRGHDSEHTRGNESLGNKIYSILKPSLLSYRVAYDFNTNRKVFSVWGGVDRTSGNTGLNNPVIFSTEYGNITEADLLIDSSSYKNSYIVSSNTDTSSNVYVYAGNERASGETGLDDAFLYKESAGSDTSISAFFAEGHGELLKRGKTLSLDFDTLEGSYEYMSDFDLGDICSVEIPELSISVDAVLTDVNEVIKKGVWRMSLGFTQI